MKKLARRRSSVGGFIAAFLLSSIPQTAAAPLILNSSLGTSCNTNYGSTYIQSNRYVATKNVNISAINILIGNQSSSYFSSSLIYIFSDNASNNFPNTILETFTPDSLGGAASTTYAHFVGSKSFTAGTKFWIVPSVQAAYLPLCSWPSVSSDSMTLNGISPDTSTSNSKTNFRRVNSTLTSPSLTGSWGVSSDANFIYQLSIEGFNPSINADLTLQNGGNKAIYRTNTYIQASVSAASRVTFYAKGKVIPTCRNVTSISGIATCAWSPSLIGVNVVTANIVSLDSSYTNGTARPFQVLVSARTNKR